MKTQVCSYCLQETPVAHIVKDHLVPRNIISGKRVKLVECCCSCNSLKRNYIFWSIESVQEYIAKKKKNPNITYSKWISEKFKSYKFKVEDLFLFSIIFDRKVPDFSCFTNK